MIGNGLYRIWCYLKIVKNGQSLTQQRGVHDRRKLLNEPAFYEMLYALSGTGPGYSDKATDIGKRYPAVFDKQFNYLLVDVVQ